MLFIEDGSGWLEVENRRAALRPSRVLLTAPGEARRWDVDRVITGRVLFFDAPLFLDGSESRKVVESMDMFQPGRPASHIDLDPVLFRSISDRLEEIATELRTLRHDSAVLLRSTVISILVHLNRAFTSQHGAAQRAAPNLLADRFRLLVGIHWRKRWPVSRYATELSVSSEHLTRMVKAATGQTAGHVLREPLIHELVRTLTYSREPVADIAYRFGFPDPSSFTRYMKRHAGLTPIEIRKRKQIVR